MSEIKIKNPEEIEADTIVGSFSEEDRKVYRRQNQKIVGAKLAIKQAIDELAQATGVQSDIWEKYAIDDNTQETLIRRGLALSVNPKTGKLSVTDVDDKEKIRSLMPYLL